MLVGCGVLIDLRQGRYRLTYRDIYGLFDELKPFLWPLHIELPLCLRRRSSSRINCSYSAFVSRSRV